MKAIVAGTALLALATGGCSDGLQKGPAGQVLVTDSAGTAVVELQGDLRTFAAPELTLTRTYRVGQERSGLELFKVSGAKFLADGRLVVASAGVPELVIVDQSGRVSRRFGNEGEGPGQFLTITSVHVTEAGTIVAFDDRQGRLTEFDSAGSLMGTRRMEASPLASLIPLVASMTGPSLAVYWDNRSLRSLGSFGRDTTPLLRYAPGSSRPDTVSKWPTKVWSFRDLGMGVMRKQAVFSPDLLAAGQADRIALADTHTPLVTVLDENGKPLMLARWSETPRAVTDADLRAWKEDRAASLPDGLPDNIRRALLEVPHYDVHPLLAAIALDREGGLWIAPVSLRRRARQGWLILDALGGLRGEVWLPVAARILDAREGRLAVLEKDDFDVEMITVFAMADTNHVPSTDAS